MKRRQKSKLIPRWEPESAFRVPIHRCVPIARRAPEILPEAYYWPEEETWRVPALIT